MDGFILNQADTYVAAETVFVCVYAAQAGFPTEIVEAARALASQLHKQAEVHLRRLYNKFDRFDRFD